MDDLFPTHKLSFLEKFLLYHKRMNFVTSYVNENNDRISLTSERHTIAKEFKLLDIDLQDKTISQLYELLKIRRQEDYLIRKISKKSDLVSKRIMLLTIHLNHLEYYLYDYDYEAMQGKVKKQFAGLRKYSKLWKSNKI